MTATGRSGTGPGSPNYRAPLDRPLDRITAVFLAAAPLLLAVAVVVEVRAITRSDRPRFRAIGALAVGVPVLLVLFASIYCLIDAGQARAFSEPLSRTDALYFTVTVFVGFGDIARCLSSPAFS